MADITDELAAINNAVYGEQVRGAIADALSMMNSQIEATQIASYTSLYRYKGTIATSNELPILGNRVGDSYYVSADNLSYAWNGSSWQSIGEIVMDYSSSTVTFSFMGSVDSTAELPSASDANLGQMYYVGDGREFRVSNGSEWCDAGWLLDGEAFEVETYTFNESLAILNSTLEETEEYTEMGSGSEPEYSGSESESGSQSGETEETGEYTEMGSGSEPEFSGSL